jgi:hypothetical protein
VLLIKIYSNPRPDFSGRGFPLDAGGKGLMSASNPHATPPCATVPRVRKYTQMWIEAILRFRPRFVVH